MVDDDNNELGTGEVGEIVHRSPHASLGYFRDEPKTAAAFRDGWFHSGDLGVIDENGYLTVVDRKNDMIKTGGENVASREVEETLYLLDGVAEAAVFGISHPRWIEAVVAVIVPKPGATLSPEHVHAHVRATLAGYKRPKYVVFADALPKNQRQDPQKGAPRPVLRTRRLRYLTPQVATWPDQPRPTRAGSPQVRRPR